LEVEVTVDAMVIRRAQIDDAPLLFELLKASSIEHDNLQELCVDADALRADGFGPSPRFEALVAECGGRPAGLALYFFTYSTWTSRNGIYLEDLYVASEYRRRGVARALMKELAGIAVAHDCRRLQWVVNRDNTPAIRFYESLGAAALSNWPLMWLAGDALTAFSSASA
jgi:ribosomal protein S18 acetylase RimI-like enzyme